MGTTRSSFAIPDAIQPALTVAAVVERAGRFLVVEELVHGLQVINQPAGHVKPGESLLQAVVRETLEETGWVFEPVAVTGLYLWRRPGTDRCFLRVAFCGHGLTHDPGRRLDDGIVQALWLSRDELLRRSQALRSPMVIRAIDDYLRGSRMAIASLQNLPLAALANRAEMI